MTALSDPAGRSDGKTIAQMSAMMFLQYWTLGLWYVTVTTFIAANTGTAGEAIFTSGFIGYSAAAAAFGSLVAPTFFGWLSDRVFPAERVLSALHLVAAIALLLMYRSTSQLGFFLALVLYFQAFAPTVTLSNTIALGRLLDRDREFPVVRVFGTVAWIAAGVFIGVICRWWAGESIEPSRLPIWLAGWSHVVMTLYALCLPPSRTAVPAETPRVVTDGWRPSRGFVWFLIVSLLAATTSQAYNLANVFLNQTGYIGAAATLTLGQVTEVFCLAAMPWLHSRVRLKTLFLIGLLGWVVRYLLLASGSFGEPTSAAAALVLVAILLHGPSYVFVYVTGQLYIDKLVDPSHRGIAQGLHTLATGGIGHFLGAGMTGWAQSAFLTPPGVDPAPYHWAPFWLTPVTLGLVVAVVFAIRFSDSTASNAAPKSPAEV